MLDEGLVQQDPIPRMSAMRKDFILPKFLSVEEVNSLISAASDTEKNTGISVRDTAILELIYGAGVRVGETFGRDVDDIDSDATLYIDDIIEDAEEQGDEDQSADVG